MTRGGGRPRFDALVVGGGPAGSSLALRLARAGVSVAILEARPFPRSKPCGDALSPGATPLLEELGVLPRILSAGPVGRLGGWRIRAPDGTWLEGRFSAGRAATPATALAVDRRELDAALLDAAVGAGAALLEGRRVFARSRSAEGLHELHARDPDGRVERYAARFVAGADGLRSRVARLLGPVRPGGRPRLALVGRFEGVDGSTRSGQLRLSGEGVLGYAPLSPSGCNVTVVVPAARAPEIAGRPEAFLRERIRAYDAEPLVEGGVLSRPIEVTGPFETKPFHRTAPGTLLVGDAAGYFDPFTGQGVFRALLGARLAASAVHASIASREREPEALERYERSLDAALRPSRILQRLIDAVVCRPTLMNPAARLLRARPGLASRLVDGTGDRIAPGDLLGPLSWFSALLERPGEAAGT